MRRSWSWVVLLALASVHGVATTQVTSGSVTVLPGGDPEPRALRSHSADPAFATPAPTPRVLGSSTIGEATPADQSNRVSDDQFVQPPAGVNSEYIGPQTPRLSDNEEDPAPEPDREDSPENPLQAAPIIDQQPTGARGLSVTEIGDPSPPAPPTNERDRPLEQAPVRNPAPETFAYDMQGIEGVDIETYDELLANPPQQIQGADLESVEALQLEEWIAQMRQAVDGHPSVRVAQLQTESSRAGVDQARAGRLPQITLSSEFGNDRSVRAGGEPTSAGGVPEERDLQLTPTLDADVLLFDAGATRATIDAARRRVEAGEDSTRAAVHDIGFRAAQNLIDLATLRAQITLAEDNLSEVRRLRAMIQERADAGRDSPSDMFRMNSRVQEARNTLEQRISAFNAARATYAEVFRAEPIILGLPAAYAPVPRTAEAAIERAVQRNAQLQQADAIAQAAQREVDARRAQRWPQVSLGASVTGYDITREGEDYYDSFIGLRVNAPLFDGGSRSAQIDQAQRQASLELARVDELRAGIVRAVSEAYSSLASLRPQLEALESQVEANRQTLAAYEEQFFTGRRPLNDLVTAQRELYGAQSERLDLRGELHLRHFTIRRLTGDLMSDYGLPAGAD